MNRSIIVTPRKTATHGDAGISAGLGQSPNLERGNAVGHQRSSVGQEHGVLTDKPGVRECLLRMVITLEENFHAREDLLQEALVHFWSSERQRPGQRLSWYLQDVKFYLQHLWASGRSVDSPKRRAAQASFPDHCDEWDNWRDSLEFDEGFLSGLVARDLFSLLTDKLPPTDRLILRRMLEGLRISEIAGALHAPRGFVDRHRLRIAKLAMKLGISPQPANPLRRACS